jgi:hypothetical protein
MGGKWGDERHGSTPADRDTWGKKDDGGERRGEEKNNFEELVLLKAPLHRDHCTLDLMISHAKL